MNLEEARQKLRHFILENYLFTDDQAALKDEDSFLDGGILDSMGILELIEHLDESFGIKVEGDELVPDNLDSINSLIKFISTKTRAS
ncbi:MAG: acyl carrier protein [Gammaproteobacteria bacterium]|nr:MAG: acyl carrier protein [Gammaproteobacteria bacterium]